MKKINFLSFFLLSLFVFTINPLIAQKAAERPNIVWIVTEDNSIHYNKLYNDKGATMPYVNALAKKGIVFNNAFSNAPVCSVARSTIISGCYAPRVGTQYHRRMKLAPMPAGLEMFPYYLRQAGYYTSNNSKEDYNFIKSDQVWDESSREASYRNREEGQPFFHVQNFGNTHEGQLHFPKEEMAKKENKTSSDAVEVFPYHPNTDLYKYTNAWYHDLHEKVDVAIGKFLEQLQRDRLLENTFVFYYGDHGGVLPRSKGYIYESGVHVPMVVYVPENWKHLVPMIKGTRSDAFVQFIDLAPTVLNLAGVDIPKGMDGKPFLGNGVTEENLNQRNTAFSHADRFDEKYDLVRAFRKGKFKYIRNYQPFNIDALFNFYRYKMLAYQEWEQLFKEGKLNEKQQQFFSPRAPEALYDLENDPHELNNLATDPSYKEVLIELRSALQYQVKSMPDLSFYPEPYFIENALENPVLFGQENKKDIADLIDVADLSMKSFKEAEASIQKALKSRNPWKRYWGLIVCSTFGKEASSLYEKAQKMAQKDKEALVRTRALEFLALTDQLQTEDFFMDILKEVQTETEANLILNSVALLETVKPDFNMTISKELFDPEWFSKPGRLVNRRVDFINKR